MKAVLKLSLIVLVGAPLAVLADEAPKLSCIKDITYSQEFLSRYPKAGAACREVVMKDGKKWVRFDADVADVRGNQVTANFVDQYKQSVATLTFSAAPEARLTIDGKEAKFSELQSGDTISVWMPESRMGFYAKPGSLEMSKFAVVSTDTTKLR
jgi:hypothetical protein